MATAITTDLEQFHQFISDKLAQGGSNLWPEEALDEWRALNPAPEERDATLRAIREGLEDIRSGRVQTFESFDLEFRRQHNIA